MRALLAALDAAGYDFTTITPATHARVARRWFGLGTGVRDLFGWSRAVDPSSVPAAVLAAAHAARLLVERDGGIASHVRVSRLAGRLFAHSAWPTDAADSVFLGPDSYRFAAFIAANVPAARDGLRVVDIGSGAGVGGIVAADLLPGATVTLTDVNARALDFAAANAGHAGIPVRLAHTRGLDDVGGPFDLALANPPFLMDEGSRAYRDGGGMLGSGVSLELAEAALAKLAPAGRLLLYTASPIVGGHDALAAALAEAARNARVDLAYRELDPDVFGEELERPVYASVERIALVGAVLFRPPG